MKFVVSFQTLNQTLCQHPGGAGQLLQHSPTDAGVPTPRSRETTSGMTKAVPSAGTVEKQDTYNGTAPAGQPPPRVFGPSGHCRASDRNWNTL